jgi:hypothetical protein
MRSLLLSASILPLLLLMSCEPTSAPNSLLESLLQDRGPIVDQVMENPEKYELQILYTQIDRDSSQAPHFTSFRYRVNADAYFYPASTVKFPIAVLAMEKLQQMGLEGLDLNTSMLTDTAFAGQTLAWQDSSAASGLPSVGNYLRKIFLVSDNDAFNRLYEFLGQGPIQDRLQQIGLNHTRIVHRLSVSMSGEQNRHTNPIRFVEGEELIYEQPAMYHEGELPTPSAPIRKGIAYRQGGELIAEPMDFSQKNAFPLEDQQQLLKQVIFPNSVSELVFDLADSDYQFLYQAMSELPRESSEPTYDPAHFYDGYCKFFLYGDGKERIPDQIRIYNKIGAAYGYLTDNAYIIDTEQGVEFLLSATLHVNENQTFNDDQYEYDKIGFPFLAELGRAIYEQELIRPKAVRPDFSRLLP